MRARNETVRTSLIGLVLVLLVVAVFGRTLGHAFVNIDDDRYVYRNPFLKRGLSAAGVRWALTTDYEAIWIPATWVSLLADFSAGGLDPSVYHRTNLLLHVTCVLLLFWMLRAWTGAVWRSALVAALFAVHPVNVEPVAWVTGRKDVLFMALGLGCLLVWRRYLSRRSLAPWLGAFGLFCLALMAKPMAVVLPPVMVLLDFWPASRLGGGRGGPGVGRLILEKAPFFLAAAVVAVVARQAAVAGEYGAPEFIPPADRLDRAAVFAVTYLGRLFRPAGLSVVYPVESLTYPVGLAIAAGAVLLAISVAAFRVRRRAPWLTVGWFWFLVSLLPVLDLIRGGQQLLSDRYLYFPAVGIFLALVWSAGALTAKRPGLRRPLAAAGLVLIAALAVASFRQAGFWRNSETLFVRALAVTTDNHTAHLNLAVHLDEAGRHQEALGHCRRSLAIKPTSMGFLDLGNILLNLDRPQEAAKAFENALRLDPGLANAHNNLGMIAAKTGRIADAEAHFRRAVEADPHLPVAHFNLGQALFLLGREAEARQEFRLTLALNPDYPGAAEALAHLRE